MELTKQIPKNQGKCIFLPSLQFLIVKIPFEFIYMIDAACNSRVQCFEVTLHYRKVSHKGEVMTVNLSVAMRIENCKGYKINLKDFRRYIHQWILWFLPHVVSLEECWILICTLWGSLTKHLSRNSVCRSWVSNYQLSHSSFILILVSIFPLFDSYFLLSSNEASV